MKLRYITLAVKVNGKWRIEALNVSEGESEKAALNRIDEYWDLNPHIKPEDWFVAEPLSVIGFGE